MNLRLTVLFLFILIQKIYSSDVKFYNINAMYGTSIREMASVCKDENGFIWASSRNGILRVTKSDCQFYQLPYKTANIISVRLIYSKSLLIAYTNNGQFFFYNELYDRFDILIDLRLPLNNKFLGVGKVVMDTEQTLWIPTSAGLWKYKEGVLTKIYKDHLNIYSIALYDEGYLFVTTQEGIELLNTKTLEWAPLYQPEGENSFYSDEIFYDRKNEILWVGTSSDGLYHFDMKKKLLFKSPIKGFPKQPIRVIEQSADSTLLIGIDGQGIWELSGDGKSVLNVFKEDVDNPESLRGDGVYDIYSEGNKRVWVATYSGGLSFFDREPPLVKQITHQINAPNSLGNNNVNKILEDSKGDIWFATNNGISRWRIATNQWDNYYQNKEEEAQVFLALCEDGEGNIWAGSYSSGFYVLERNTGKELAHYPQHASMLETAGKFIMDIYKDSEGDIWVGGIQDLICYQTKEKRFRSYTPQPVRSFMELSPGKILLACTYGLLLLDKKTENIDYLVECLAQDVLAIGNDIWVGTGGDGLFYCNYETRETRKITMDSGLPSDYVNSIMYDNGYLWLGTENGICRYNPADSTIHTYYSILALSNVSFNINSNCKLKNGELVWGTSNGTVMFDTNKLYHAQPDGQIFFQNISISGRSIREIPGLLKGIPVNKQTALSLRHDENTLTLEMLSIGLSSKETKFSWKMDGLETEWNHPSNQRVITYANIPNGDFKLRIRMCDNTSPRIVTERTLNITVIPPFWQTGWFYLIIFIFVIGIAFFFLKLYINRLKRRHAEDKIRFFVNIAHDIRTSLTLINAPIEELNKERELSGKGRFYLGLATEQSGHLSYVATQLLDFQKVDAGKGQLFLIMVDIVSLVYKRKMMFEATAGKRDIKLEFSSDRESFISAVDELKMEKVIDNLISNAIKYSHSGGKVEITLVCNEDGWSLMVKDYGLGISEHAQKKLFKEFYRGDNSMNSKMVGSGIGLLLVKSYVSMHGGKVSLQSKKNEGSLFRISLPYKKVDEITILPDDKKGKATGNGGSSIYSNVKAEENVGRKGKYILIVEDNTDLQNFLKCSLSELYTISVANDGVEAWNLLRKETPDLIISDVMMPNMDGFELCRLIKSTFETSHIPVILLTALCEKSDQLEGLGLGADDYITKPFDVNILIQRIKSLVKNREMVRERILKLINLEDNKQPVLSNELNDQFVKKALEVIHNNLTNPDFDKESFAAEMHVSSSLLYKKMKTLTGQSPIDFIKMIRLNRALELLQAHKYSITEVSELCGFSSISYFSTVFKKSFGKSPTEI